MHSDAHESVLLEPAIKALAIRPGGCYLDATWGRGGHARAILAALGPKGVLLGIDQDPQAMVSARSSVGHDPRVRLWQGNFAAMNERLAEQEVLGQVDGILLDLGVSSPQLDDPARGFSFSHDGPLDMRMDPTSGRSAQQWLASATEAELARVLWEYGEERYARRIAAAIVKQRRGEALTSTLALARLIGAVVPRPKSGKHPATRSFQAIRIQVNGELDALTQALEASLSTLAPGGRLVVISFHSLEDRAVKRFMRAHSQRAAANRRWPEAPGQKVSLRLVGRAIAPTAEEVAHNPRARSARMRVAERLS